MYIYIYMLHTYIYIYIYIYIYMYTHIRYRRAERRRPARRRRWRATFTRRRDDTDSFHNFKSQKFKLSVSNPKSKHVAYLSVLSQISNCQGLGRKNKFDFLKTYRTPNNTIRMIIV